jgi:hypothetical protein
MRPALLSTALVLAAMAAPASADKPRSSRAHHKPSAPVALTITSRAATAGVRVVVLDAVATRDVPAIELTLAGTSVRFGATRAGEHRTLEATIPADTATDVIGAARVGTGGSSRSRAIALKVAPAEREKPYMLYTVKGRAIQEVRE